MGPLWLADWVGGVVLITFDFSNDDDTRKKALNWLKQAHNRLSRAVVKPRFTLWTERVPVWVFPPLPDKYTRIDINVIFVFVIVCLSGESCVRFG